MIDWTKLFCFGCLGSVAIMALICYVQTQWKHRKRWPREQHPSYFSSCKRVSEE